jgi:hypothetical protein
MDFKFATRTLILALASCSFMPVALAQWQWIDKDGRKVFSDRSPPAEIQEKDILKRPGGKSPSLPASSADPAPTTAAAVKAGAPKLSGKDAQLEARKKQADEDEATKKKIEEEKLAHAKADNCERAHKGLATIQSGVRLSVVNAKGEREFMDDNARAAESKRLQGIAASECAR